MADYVPRAKNITRNGAYIEWDGATKYGSTNGTVKCRVTDLDDPDSYIFSRNTQITSLVANTNYSMQLFYIANDTAGGEEVNIGSPVTFKTEKEYAISEDAVSYNEIHMTWTGKETYDATGYPVYIQLEDEDGNVIKRSTEKTITFNGLTPDTDYVLKLVYLRSGAYWTEIDNTDYDVTTAKMPIISINSLTPASDGSSLAYSLRLQDCNDVTSLAVSVNNHTVMITVIPASGDKTGTISNTGMNSGAEYTVTVRYAVDGISYTITEKIKIPKGVFTFTTFNLTGIVGSCAYSRSGWTNYVRLSLRGEDGQTKYEILKEVQGSSCNFTPTEMKVSDWNYCMYYCVELVIKKDGQTACAVQEVRALKKYVPVMLSRTKNSISFDTINEKYENTENTMGIGLFDDQDLYAEFRVLKDGKNITFTGLDTDKTYYAKEYYKQRYTFFVSENFVRVKTLSDVTVTGAVSAGRTMAQTAVTIGGSNSINSLKVYLQKKLNDTDYSERTELANIPSTQFPSSGAIHYDIENLNISSRYRVVFEAIGENFTIASTPVDFITSGEETETEQETNVVNQSEQTDERIYKPFLIAVGEAGAYTDYMLYEDPFCTKESYGLYIKHSPFSVLPQIKEPVTQDWLDEQGEDAYLPPTGIMNKAFDFEATFIYWNTDGMALVNIRRFQKRITGKWLKIYDTYTQMGRKGVYVNEFEKDPQFKSRRMKDGSIREYVEFKVQFKVNDPNTDIILTKKDNIN